MDEKLDERYRFKKHCPPPLRARIPKKAFTRLFMVAFPLCVTRSLPLIIMGVLLYYGYLLRKTRVNPFFMEEASAQKSCGKTQNIHYVTGNYYSA